MLFFATRKDIVLDTDSPSPALLAPPEHMLAAARIPEQYIYCCSVAQFVTLGRTLEALGIEPPMYVLPETTVKQRSGFPVELGASNAGELERNLYASGLRDLDDNSILCPGKEDLQKNIGDLQGKDIRIALVNGLGSGLGDTLTGLTALREANRIISERLRPSFEVLCNPDQCASLNAVFRQSGLIVCTRELPMTLKELMQFDAYVDNGGLTHREDFNTLPLVDFFLKAFGIDYARVPAARKRNRINLHDPPDSGLEHAIREARRENRQLLLFHPVSSTGLRSIPGSEVPGILDELCRDSGYRVVTALSLGYQHPDLLDLSGFSNGFSGLCNIISQMDAILTVDTSVYHIADCFGIPTVVWFTSIDPELRVGYYPAVHGILLDGACDTGLISRHTARQEDDLEPVRQLWANLAVPDALQILEEMAGSNKRP